MTLNTCRRITMGFHLKASFLMMILRQRVKVGFLFIFCACHVCGGGFRGTLDWHATASCQMSSRLFAISVKHIAYYK